MTRKLEACRAAISIPYCSDRTKTGLCKIKKCSDHIEDNESIANYLRKLQPLKSERDRGNEYDASNTSTKSGRKSKQR